jgi:hypothetical protein
MDLGTHIFTGVLTASFWPSLDLRQKILVILFSILPDSFEWAHQWARKVYDKDDHLTVEDYNRLSKKIEGHWYMGPYNLFHNLLTPLAFFVLSVIFHWPLVYSLLWLIHLLLDLPSHKIRLGLKLWWPFSEKRIHGFFDWWLVKFFRGWELWGYWAILTVISVILIRSFW